MTSLVNPTILEVDTEFAGIADELTRRGFLAGGLGSAALLGLAACGSSDSESSTAPSGAGTRQVNTIHGKVDVPSDPKRVVAVSFIGTANLLDLGVTPVGGTTGGVEFLPDYKARLAAMPLVADSSGKVDLEAIAALHPDLIVGSDWASGSPALLPYTKLREIAPTAVFEQAPSVGNWTDQAHGYADAVNKIEALEPLRQKFLAVQERIRTTYADLLQTLRWEIINAGDDGWYRYSTSASHCKVLAGAGFRFTDAAAAQETAFAQLSNEQLGQLRPASAIGLGRSVNTSWDKSLTGQKLFQRLPAVKNDHLTRLKWFFPSSYGTARALLTQIEPILTTWNNAR
ncbi:hypothetical protein GCM10011575_13320 [Microlunatus endophyticus]|uniref:Fe/B12 periplasmic-binding domain-containing protein n=1 Tax=Microlunatus endophyticus TaxID=1716077 RepID=A0A917W2Q3_9ACTN|nr:ABC transporter substrate-binding protein [Microlunatus endophyticus]GGL56243.1 hypothetical protein GCM10011575_13320 [Microlunatus endophyticus]